MSATPLPFESKRPFQLWKYSVSHKQLLLRSNRDESRQTRVDVLFTNVSAMRVATHYETLRVVIAIGDEAAEVLKSLGIARGPHSEYYVIGGDPKGFVVAGGFAALEDEGSFSDPSGLLATSAL
jgi:hypothetical protein